MATGGNNDNRKKLMVLAIAAVVGIGIILTAPVYALTADSNSTASDGTMAAATASNNTQHPRTDIQGSLKISSILDQIISKSGITLADAASKAAKAANGNTVEGRLSIVQGYLVYDMRVLSDDGMHRVIIDAGNGNVLLVSQAHPLNDNNHLFNSGNQHEQHNQKKLSNHMEEQKERIELENKSTANNQ